MAFASSNFTKNKPVKAMYIHSNISKLLSYFILACVGYSIIIVFAMHYFNMDFDPISRYVSEYALGKYGKFVSTSFAVYGFAIIALRYLLQQSLPMKMKSSKGFFLLTVAGVSMILIALFSGDIKGAPITIKGAIHLLAAGIGMPAFIISSILISIALRHEVGWRNMANLGLYIELIALFGLFFLYFGIPSDLLLNVHYQIPHILSVFSNFAGLSERILLMANTIWMMLIATWYIKDHS